jgi:hypothetical protein
MMSSVFACTGRWSADEFVCMIPGTDANGASCAEVPWAILASGNTPNDDQPLATGQIWAGTYVPGQPNANGFDAVCDR